MINACNIFVELHLRQTPMACQAVMIVTSSCDSWGPDKDLNLSSCTALLRPAALHWIHVRIFRCISLFDTASILFVETSVLTLCTHPSSTCTAAGVRSRPRHYIYSLVTFRAFIELSSKAARKRALALEQHNSLPERAWRTRTTMLKMIKKKSLH